MKNIYTPQIKIAHLQLLVTIIIASLHLFFSDNSFAQANRIWATYCGGSGDEIAYGCATDASGNVYICGWTNSPNKIATPGAFQTSGNSLSLTNFDLYLVKYNAAGNRIWGTYYGGAGNEEGNAAVTVDPSGNVYLTGSTTSSTGIASGGFQNSYAGGGDAFLVKFDSGGHRLWSTYYGGTNDDEGMNVATDAAGNVYMEGITGSTSGIASGGFQNTYGGGNYDNFLVKFDGNGNRLWATYYGGKKAEYFSDIRTGLATDATGNVYISGITYSDSGIAYNGFRNTYTVAYWSVLGINEPLPNAFLVKFDANGNRKWATYYGGTGGEFTASVAADASGNVYLAGETGSEDSIAYHGFKDSSIYVSFGNNDIFLVKFDSSCNRLWGTYYGGDNQEENGVVKTDKTGKVYLAGSTYSSSGIASGGFINTLPGTEIDFVATFDADGNRQCATYYGAGHDEETYIAIDGSGNVYLSGNTHSADSIASGGFQNTFGGGSWDSYLVKFSSCASCAFPMASISAAGPTTFCPGGSVTLKADTGNGYTYKWSTGATGNSINVSLTGNYSVLVTNSCSSANSNTISVSVGNDIQPGVITAVRDTICKGTSGNLLLSGNSSNTIQWQSSVTQGNFTNNGPQDTIQYKTPPLSQTTYYRVMVGSGACLDSSGIFRLYVPPVLVASFNSTKMGGNEFSFNSDSSIGAIRSYHWDFGDDSTSNDRNPLHTYAKDTTYYVCLTLYDGSNCSYTYCRYLSVISGIPTVPATGNFIIYPNPFGSSIFIENTSGNEPVSSIEIYNVLGQIVLDKKNTPTQPGTIQLDVSSLINGVYEIKIKSENTNYIRKLIKLK